MKNTTLILIMIFMGLTMVYMQNVFPEINEKIPKLIKVIFILVFLVVPFVFNRRVITAYMKEK